MEFLKRLLTILCLLSPTVTMAHVYTVKPNPVLVMENDTVCAQDQDGVHCYEPFKSTHPYLNEGWLRDFSLWNGYAYRLHSDGKLTYGRLPAGPQSELNLNKPYAVFGNCVLDFDGARCAKLTPADKEIAWIPQPDLKMQEAIYLGLNQSCALSYGALTCWDRSQKILTLDRTRKLAPLYDIMAADVGQITCAIQGHPGDSKLSCWDYYSTPYQFNITNPRLVSVGTNPSSVCAAGDEGVRCWSNEWDPQTRQPKVLFAPVVRNPIALSVKGNNSACAIDDSGLICWNLYLGKRFRGDTSLVADTALDTIHLDFKPTHPTVQNPQFNLDQLNELLEVLAKISTPARSRFYSELNKFVSSSLTANRYISNVAYAWYAVAKLITPSIESMNSKYSVETLIPRFKMSMGEIDHDMKMDSVALVPKSDLALAAALRTIVAAITVAKDFAQEGQKEQLASLLRPLGQAIAAPNASNITEAVAQIEDRKPVFETLAANPRSAFLIDTIYTAQEWLRR